MRFAAGRSGYDKLDLCVGLVPLCTVLPTLERRFIMRYLLALLTLGVGAFFVPLAATTVVTQDDACVCATVPDEGAELPNEDMTAVPGYSAPVLVVSKTINSAVDGECDVSPCLSAEPCAWNYTLSIATPTQANALDLYEFRHRGTSCTPNWGGNTVITRSKAVDCSNTWTSFLTARDDQDNAIAGITWQLKCDPCEAST